MLCHRQCHYVNKKKGSVRGTGEIGFFCGGVCNFLHNGKVMTFQNEIKYPDSFPLNLQVSTNPDSARKQLLSALAAVNTSFAIMIYQITDDDLCDALVSMKQRKVDLSILVSRRIFSSPDYYKAQVSRACTHDACVRVALCSFLRFLLNLVLPEASVKYIAALSCPSCLT